MNKWDDLKQAVRSKRVADAPPVSVPSTPTTRLGVPRNLYLLGLLVLALSLGLAILATNQDKEGGSAEIKIGPPSASSPVKIDGKVQVSVPQASTEVDDLRRKFGVMDKKLMLLGTAHNNNWHVLQNRYPANDLVYFGADWRLNQFPPHIDINESDRATLADWVVQ